MVLVVTHNFAKVKLRVRFSLPAPIDKYCITLENTMFTLFKKLTSPVAKAYDVGAAIFENQKMSLEERKAWRQAMMQKSVTDVFTSLEIISGMYRFRALPVDDRGHRYAIIVETTSYFALNNLVSTHGLTGIELELKSKAFSDYGVVVDGIYWKADDTIGEIDHAVYPTLKPKKTIDDLRQSFCDTMPLFREEEETIDPLTPEEAAAFKAALSTRYVSRLPLKIGGRDYDTDIASL